MTELEKLARDFAATETYVDSQFTASNAFAAGFRKARELAAAIVHYQDSTLEEQILALGESEVNQS
jgi:hypothetical protein